MSTLSDKDLELAEFIQQNAIEEGVKKAQQHQCDLIQFHDWDGECCYDCGFDLPKIRLDNGRVRCIDCQTTAERKGII